MQGVAIAFHVYYCAFLYRSVQAGANRLKWAEYGLSATLGTLAVATSGAASTAAIAALIAAGTTQQLIGSVIDRNVDQRPWKLWWAAAALQALEFAIIGTTRPDPRLFAAYLVGWSLFGVHCGLHIALCDRPPYSNREWVEAVYSCLGWSAKLAVVLTEVAVLDGGDVDTVLATVLIAMAIALAATAAARGTGAR